MIAATIEGPSYAWSPNNDETTIEVFHDLESAIIALMERRHSNGRTFQTYTTLDGERHTVLFPAFDEGTSFTCYTVGGMLIGKPTEDQVMDTLTEVHSQVWTWKLTLGRAEDSGRLAVIVEANRG